MVGNLPSLTELQAYRARKRLSRFIKYAWDVLEPGSPFLSNWHIDLICEYLHAVTLGEITRLLINIPPRHLKSRTVTTCWPVWEWIDSPHHRYLFSSYNIDLARDHSRERRMIIESEWYQQKWGDRYELLADQNVVTYFANNKGGRMQARGTGGSGTGKGGSRIIVDDPHNVKQAEGKVQREAAIMDFDKNLMTRLDNPKTGAIIIVMQRLHDMDLSGHVLRDVGGYMHVKIPLVAETQVTIDFPLSGKQIVRKPGDILQPERENDETIAQKKRTLGTAGYAAQYQQEPVPDGGNRIKLDWFGRYQRVPERTGFKKVVQSWDTGNKPKDTSAPSVCTTFGLTDKGWFVIDLYREQVGYPELKRQVIKKFNKWRPDAVLIEDKASGISLIQDMKENYPLIPVIPIQPEADKITRMETQSAHIEAGQLFLPEKAEWLSAFEAEMMRFPEPDTWDIIDTVSQFLKWEFGRKPAIVETKLKGL